jgi:hypothetical protein
MEKMFCSMMQGFFNGMSEGDKEKMKACCEQMVAKCPCGNMKDVPEAEKQAMMEKMRSCCGDKMGMMSAFVQSAGAAK